MYTKDKNQRVTLRLNAEQFEFVKTVADALGVSPSEYLRMMVNLFMAGAKRISDEQQQQQQKESERRENEQTSGDDIV